MLWSPYFPPLLLKENLVKTWVFQTLFHFQRCACDKKKLKHYEGFFLHKNEAADVYLTNLPAGRNKNVF